MASIHVDIDLSDINTWELVEELSQRALCLSDTDKQELLDAIKYRDAEKWKWFLSIKDKYSLLELQEKFNENSSVVISKEQLAIQF